MHTVKADKLFETGRAHAMAAAHLFESSIQFAKTNGVDDPELFAFNGTFSLSVHYLMGLGAELMLKAAYIGHGGDPNPKHLRTDIGHDLIKALDHAEEMGFEPSVENLREILEHLREPYLMHFFRYDRPDKIVLPDIPVVIEMFAALDEQISNELGWETYQ